MINQNKKPITAQENHYYPFGMAMKGRSFQDSLYRHGFNGKENDTDFGNKQLVQDYGFRIYNPSIGRFLSVDPLTKSYPWNSPYAFAENRVIDGIDLEGGEYLRADESLVEVINGTVMLKVQNLGSSYMRGQISIINHDPSKWTPGVIGFDRRITDLSPIMKLPQMEMATPDGGVIGAPTFQSYTGQLKVNLESPRGPSDTKGGADKRFSQNKFFNKDWSINQRSNYGKMLKNGLSTNSANNAMGKGVGILGLAINVLNIGASQYISYINIQDNDKYQKHLNTLRQANNALTQNIDLIPLEYRNFDNMSNILNFMLQGVNNSGDANIEKIAIDILKEVGEYQDPNEIILPDFYSDFAPADNVRTEQQTESIK